ncbi:MAG: hypothetical protein AAF862_07020 [Pseudomonadota bacterium]
MAHTFNPTRPGTHVNMSAAIARLIRDNVLRVGLVLVGMTLFIAAAEANTQTDQIDLTNLPQLVTQVANQSALPDQANADRPYIARQYLASDDYAAGVAQSNLLNSPAARFLAKQLN